MNVRRTVLRVLSGVLFVAALLLLTVDVHADDQDCGSAIIPRDTSNLTVDTGNVARDDFATQEVLDDCAHDLFRQRFVCGGLFVLSIGATIAARPRRVHRVPFPGDPIV